MPSDHTANYQLNQWAKSDQVLMEDFNADNAKIDAAIKTEARARAAETAALSAKLATRGNCKIVTGQYTGTGTYGEGNEKIFSFDKPVALFGMILSGGIIFTGPNCQKAYCLCKGTSTEFTVTWESEKRLVFSSTSSPGSQVNTNGRVYSYFAIMVA